MTTSGRSQWPVGGPRKVNASRVSAFVRIGCEGFATVENHTRSLIECLMGTLEFFNALPELLQICADRGRLGKVREPAPDKAYFVSFHV